MPCAFTMKNMTIYDNEYGNSMNRRYDINANTDGKSIILDER